MSAFGDYPERPVRPYVVTGGRARPTRNTIRPETLLAAIDGKALPVSASSEQRALLRMCRRLLSLVEASAYLQLPVSAVSVVASDLVDDGLLAMRVTSSELPHGTDRGGPDLQLLQEVLNGLQKLV